MAIFSKKEKKGAPVKDDKKAVTPVEEQVTSAPKEKAPVKAKKATKASATNLTKGPSRILKNPRITEKAVYMTMNHTYVFDVAQDATKRDVMTAVKALYDCDAPQSKHRQQSTEGIRGEVPQS